MKKYLFIFGLVGTALFTACSTADDLISEKPFETPIVEEPKENALIVEAGQNSEVPITLGVGESRGYTRNPIESGEGKVFSTEDGCLGVFCLATGTQSNVSNIPSEISANKWKDDNTGLLVRMKNVPAKVVNGNVTFLDGDGEDPDKVKHYYYPMGNWMKYNFYSYYPRQKEDITYAGVPRKTIEFNKVGTYYYLLEKYFEIDGTQDIIWGKAHPETAPKVSTPKDADPFCAKYFRLKKDSIASNDPSHPEKISELYPKMTFEHKLVQFRFFVKAVNPKVADEITINNMYIPNALGYLSLVMANQDPNPAANMKEGTINLFGNKVVTKKLNIKQLKGEHKDEDSFDGVNSKAITTSVDYDNPIGYLMLASPTIAGSFKYSLFLDFSADDSKHNLGFDSTGTLSVDLDIDGGFKEGNIYNIVVTIQSPEEIHATATLDNWTPVAAPVELNAN